MALSTDPSPEFDVRLSKAGTEVGMRLVNGKGEHDPFAISQDQQSRSAIKVASGDTKHSDYEPPYGTEEVRDWSVGRGINDGDLEEGRYFDGKAAWTPQKGRTMNGPAWRFTDGYGKEGCGNFFDEEGDVEDYDQENTYEIVQLNSNSKRGVFSVIQNPNVLDPDGDPNFVYAGNTTVHMILRKVGTPPTGYIRIYTVDGNYKPNTLIGSYTILASDVTNDGEWMIVKAEITTSANVAPLQYIAVGVECLSAPSAEHYWEVLGGAYTINDYTWYNNAGTSYDACTDGGPYFRFQNKKRDFQAFFEIYRGVPYCIVVYDDEESKPEVYRNGFFGRVNNAYNSGGVGYMWDQFVNNDFPDNDALKGWQLLIFDGKGSGEITSYYTITANNTYQLTLDKEWRNAPNQGSHYAIVGGDYWFKEDASSVFNTGDIVTDVKTILGAMYIMRGDYTPPIKMVTPYYSHAPFSLSTCGFEELSDIRGTYIEYAQDSNSQPRIWIATKDHIEKSTSPPPSYDYFGESVETLDFSQGDLVTNGDMEDDSDWSTVGSPESNERSSEYVFEGSYARKVVAKSDGEGITQTLVTTTGDYYLIEAKCLVPLTATITNGDMELDSDWGDSGSPTTNERSTTQVNGGTYSRHVVCDDDDEGIEQELTGLTAGKYYDFLAFIFIDAGSANGITMTIDSTDLASFSATGAFTLVHGVFLATGATHTLKFLSDGGSAEFYVDDVTSGSANGVKLMFAGSEVQSMTDDQEDTWVDFKGYVRASAASHTIQVLSDGGPAVFHTELIRCVEAPTQLRSAKGEKINNLIAYGEPERLWVLTDAGLYQEGSGHLVRVPIDEMRSASDNRNGRAAVTYDVYLFFSYLNGSVERYYKSNLDDVGPDRDEGLPMNLYDTDRRGDVMDMAAYPTGIYMAVDAGDEKSYAQSSIQFWNNTGFHEVFRADDYGGRIRALMIQPIQGDRCDKLWFQYDTNLCWLYVDKNPANNRNYRYNYQAILESPWIYRGKHDVEKFFRKAQLFTRYQLDENETEIAPDVEFQRRVDDETTWTSDGTFTATPQDELDIGSYDISGDRFKYRVLMETNDNRFSAWIEAVTIDLIENVPVKDSWTFQFLLSDVLVDIPGKEQTDRVEEVVSQINTWRRSPVPVYFETVHSAYDGNYGPIVSFSTKPIKVDSLDQREEMVGTITLIEA